LISTLATTVRSEGAGSVEGLVWRLSRELTQLGNDVRVFGAAGSETVGEFVATLPGRHGTAGAPKDWRLCEWINLCCAVEQSERFDILHSHAYLWGLPLERLSHAPMAHTMHILPGEDAAFLRTMSPMACVTATSQFQWSSIKNLPPTRVIYDGVDPSDFRFQAHPHDYVCFLGRFTPGKGVLQAIAISKELGSPLILAGPRNEYFERHVEPLVDGYTARYVGSVVGDTRNQLLGNTRALLYPLSEPEPFGLVQIEAMMCGTPVAATRIGAVSEIVDEGITGFTAESADDLPA
jgi:glycosyltransferase involved in cell wall biosynthesis